KVSDALVWGGTQHYVPLVGDGNINIILPATASGKVSASIVYQGPIKAPIRKGDRVAMLRITSSESSATNEIPLYAADDVAASNFLMRGLDSLGCLAFSWLLVIPCHARRPRPADSSHLKAGTGRVNPPKPASLPIGSRAPA